MTEPYVSFDTLTVGAEYDAAVRSAGPAAAGAAPVLARLPRVEPQPKAPPIHRCDDPEPEPPASHLGVPPQPAAAPPADTAAANNKFASIRIDAGAPPTADGAPAQPSAAPPIAASPTLSQPAESVEASQAAGGWLLDLEATIQPYSRWIALAAVIAALGLTAVLLQSGPEPVIAPAGAPQVDIGPTSHSLVEIGPGENTAPRAAARPTAPVAPTTLAGSPPPPSSSGPPSAYPATARPELTHPFAPAAEVAEAPDASIQLR
ncbi:hypothetical protein [Botrimarina sp.]|uniref:hypothetical protein n=1 Tax=Botrimarina sp. TaxID=2795802 RepID=UPI0032EB607B